MIFDRHPDVRIYEDTVSVAIGTRTERTVSAVTMENRSASIELDAEPSTAELEEIDDVLAATERHRVSVNGRTVVYELQEVDPDNPDLPDRHLTFDERIAELVGDQGQLGRNIGGVAPADVAADTTGRAVSVDLPADASDEARDRTKRALLSFGLVEDA